MGVPVCGAMRRRRMLRGGGACLPWPFFDEDRCPMMTVPRGHVPKRRVLILVFTAM